MQKDYSKTVRACFVGFIVQAIINNFLPLLFVNFNKVYNLPLPKITLLVTFNFVVQLCVDVASIGFVDRLGYRVSMLLADGLSALGLITLSFLPDLLPDPYVGIMISVVLYAVGSGLLEVLLSPIMNSCPSDNKEAAMSLLHSFYCWGHMGVVLLSTVFFAVFGIEHWKILSVLWAIVPMVNFFSFTKVPIGEVVKDGEKGFSLKELLGQKLFWIFLLLMITSGACEQAVAQWASTFAEKGLGVSKTVGDLAGPMMFALTMGISRGFYGKRGDRIPLVKFITGSVILCVVSYLIISLSPVPALGLIGCGLSGFAVAILWPGTLSMASASMPRGGTVLYAMLALGGDIGCSLGPTFVGFVSDAFGGDFRKGIFCALIFPILMLVGIFLNRKAEKN